MLAVDRPPGVATPAAGAARQAKQAEQQGADAAAAGAGEAADSTTEAVEASPLLPAGVTTYTDIFSAAELHAIEAHCDELHSKRSLLPPACQHSTFGRGGGLKRTKYFFGARYLWTREQLSGVDAQVARGVRVDVPLPPAWVKVGCDWVLACYRSSFSYDNFISFSGVAPPTISPPTLFLDE